VIAFRCEIVTASGRLDRIEMEAINRRAVIAQLLADGATPIRISSGKPNLLDRLNEPLIARSGFGVAAQALLLTQLAALIRAGLPLDRSLDLLADQAASRSQRTTLSAVVRSIRAGDGPAHAFERARVFPDWVIGVLRSAEQAGSMGEALGSLAARLGDLTRTRRELVSALTYPAAVLAATILALGLVLLVVVPQFRPIFAGQEARLPLLTQAVLWLSDHTSMLVPATVAIIVVPVALLMAISRSPGLAKRAEKALPIVPGLRLRDQYLAAQFAGLLATLLSNGLTLVKALPLVAAGMSSRRWRRHLRCVVTQLRQGAALSPSLLKEPFVPATLVRLLEIGERTGKLAETALEASIIVDEAARARMQRIVSLANPIAIMSLGTLVAALVAGVMLGIFAIGDFTG
jgi:type II secretory pathway component PulF